MAVLLRTDFDNFLFASIGEDAAGAPMSLLTALARLDVDAWEEAAKLARLPLEPATQRLSSLLATLPNGPAPGESMAIAARLIAILHRPPPKRPVRPADAPPLDGLVARARGTSPALRYGIALTIIVVLAIAFAWS
jgi:hypothetical protein